MPPTNLGKNRLKKAKVAPTRRQFLKTSAAALAASTLSSCGWTLADVKSTPTMQGDTDTLYIFTWAGYTDKDLLDRFYQETGIRVIADVFDSNEVMLAKIQAGAGAAYSVIYPSDYMVEKMTDLDLLTKLDKSLLVGIDDLFPQFIDPVYDPGGNYSVPLSWGTTGLIYNSTLLEKSPEDWTYLWENREALSRRMTLLEDPREVFGATLRMLGYSYNTTNADQVRQAYEELLEIIPFVASLTNYNWRSQMLTGDLKVAMCYSSDAAEITPENEDLRYITPDSGSSLWTDTLVIPKAAPNPAGAYKWINFMLQPEIAAEVVDRLSFATPSVPAYKRLPEELRDDATLFPPESVIANCESLAPVGDFEEVYDRYWTLLTST